MSKLVDANVDVYSTGAVDNIQQLTLASREPEHTGKVVDANTNRTLILVGSTLLILHRAKVKLDCLKGCMVALQHFLQPLHRVNLIYYCHLLSPCDV